MATHIPQPFIEEVLARTDIVSLIHSRVALKRSGKNFTACCPFHKEKTPSFSVSPDKQFYYCFGCGASGNAISFLRDYEHCHFIDALSSLAQTAGLTLPTENIHNDSQVASTRPLYEMLSTAQNYFREQLKSPAGGQKAIPYLKKRQLTGSIARDFALGYAPPGWDNLSKALVHSDKDMQHALDSGLIVSKDNRHYDRFRDRIMFPIRDLRGRTIAFGGRVLGDDKPKYLNSPEGPLFQKSNELYGLYEALQNKNKPEKILIVEGYIDVIALAQHGLNFAVATLGTATSQSHLEKLFRYTPELVFCFDGDNAGRKAAQRALETALPSLKDGRQARFLFLPEGEDPDSLVRSEGKELFTARLNKAQSISDFLFDHLRKDVNTESLDGKARLATLAFPLLAQLPSGMLQELIIAQLAEQTQIEVSTLNHQIKLEQQKVASRAEKSRQAASSEPIQHRSPPQTLSLATNSPPWPQGENNYQHAPPEWEDDTSAETDPSVKLVNKAIRPLLQSPETAQDIEIPNELRELNLPHANLLISLLELLKENTQFSTAALLGHWHGTQEGSKLALIAAQEFLLPAKDTVLELKETIKQLRKLHISQAIHKQIELDRRNASKDGSNLKKLLDLKKQLYSENKGE